MPLVSLLSPSRCPRNLMRGPSLRSSATSKYPSNWAKHKGEALSRSQITTSGSTKFTNAAAFSGPGQFETKSSNLSGAWLARANIAETRSSFTAQVMSTTVSPGQRSKMSSFPGKAPLRISANRSTSTRRSMDTRGAWSSTLFNKGTSTETSCCLSTCRSNCGRASCTTSAGQAEQKRSSLPTSHFFSRAMTWKGWARTPGEAMYGLCRTNFAEDQGAPK
mmetsp:Transcript_146552/g.468087  ORF Transcript_146552/g.468087 Transcript_146552/m.468087 type:complete len:220 (-) Transcript_146552:393-1052(-)